MWENNLFNFVTMVLPKLTRELPRPFKMVGVERDDDTPQHKAIREAMTNCIIHADLMLNSVLKVEKYDDTGLVWLWNSADKTGAVVKTLN
jgi:predicted HTH transcriptional regulator